jgi:hypothetical protein
MDLDPKKQPTIQKAKKFAIHQTKKHQNKVKT